jgi:hypothetical protein
VSVVCCQVEVPVSGSSLVEKSPNKCGVSEYSREALILNKPWKDRRGLLRNGGKIKMTMMFCWRKEKKDVYIAVRGKIM